MYFIIFGNCIQSSLDSKYAVYVSTRVQNECEFKLNKEFELE